MPKKRTEKSKCSKELHRQKNILFQRLKKLNLECGTSTMTFIFTKEGVMHTHYSPDVPLHKVKECMKPLVEMILQKRQLSKNNPHHHHLPSSSSSTIATEPRNSSSSQQQLMPVKFSEHDYTMVETIVS